MRLFAADLLMALGALILLGASVGVGGQQTLGLVATGLFLATSGFLLDLRSTPRRVVFVGILVSWIAIPGWGIFVASVVAALLLRRRSAHVE